MEDISVMCDMDNIVNICLTQSMLYMKFDFWIKGEIDAVKPFLALQ